MKNINFNVYLCDKCGEIILINDFISMGAAHNHMFKCVCNKELVKTFDDELKKCACAEEMEELYAKYYKLLM